MKTQGRITIYTVGHSTHATEDFLALLRQYGITLLVDVRTIPRSRHNPQFNREVLEELLPSAGLGYLHLKELGGLRHPRRDSPNTGWHNDSFRGYADYMLTEPFSVALETLISLAEGSTAAVMCAEAVPWRCHRSLIGDALLVRGVEVMDILSARESRPHALSRMASVRGTEITYPPEPSP